jgi:hypothetical protein
MNIGLVLSWQVLDYYRYNLRRIWTSQSLLPSLGLSSRCSNLSRALSPEHASESDAQGVPLLAPSRIGYSFHIIYI